MASSVWQWVIGLGLLAIAWRISISRMRVADTPRSRCAGVFVGFNNVQGVVASVTPSPAHFSGEIAAWWSATLEYEWEVTRRVTHRDADGNERTELQTHYEFRIDSRWASPTLISITDETGSILVDTEKAKVGAPMRFEQYDGVRMAGIGFAVVPGSRPTGLVRNREYRLHDNDAVFCLGYANVDASGSGLVIDGKGNDEFLVTTTPPTKVARRRRVGAWLLGLAGSAVIVATAGTVGWAGVRAAILGLVVTAWLTGMVWNRLIRVKELQQRAWSLIEVQLSRRAVLIPQLVECARGYAAHEASLLEQLTQMRNDGAAQWLALSEQYPNLKADSVFQKVFDELRDTETRLASSRAYFNDTITLVRDRTGTFPGVLLVPLARAGRFGAMQPIAAGAEASVAPDIRTLLGSPLPPPRV
jgi:LemA protein